VTILEAGAALHARKISVLELTEECLGRIAQRNPELNAFITVTEESARARATEMDREMAAGVIRGPLHGIPIAHKDLICTKGVRTTSGSKLFENFVPDHDAAVVRKLDTAGVVTLGKTGLHELAYGVTSDNPHFGAIRNPHDPERVPGGSSGGSGVAVSTGMALMATGTDTGGSIRIPASYCGVVGLKPTYGLVDRSGVKPLGLSLDHVGPLTMTVRDAVAVFDVMAEWSRWRPAPQTIQHIRVGVPENFYFDRVDSEVSTAVHESIRAVERLGARIVPVRVPDINALNTAARMILLVEAPAVFEPYLGQRDKFGSDVLALLDQGRLIHGTDYVNAQRVRKMLAAEFRRLFDSVDCLFTPATPITAPRIGEKQVQIGGETEDTRLATTRFVRGINALGYPALSVPCGKTRAGLPIGLQIIGRPYEDDLVLMVGGELEATNGAISSL
jgi:aspartyl-tRNA(Asn)/glutamyl-tRNA(Gln) amidotransferase subunit A